jgi:hypothetical protein
LLDACVAFSCEPWIGVYVETAECADMYLTSLDNYEKKYRGRIGKAIDDWKMGTRDKQLYEKDPDVRHVRINFDSAGWSVD